MGQFCSKATSLLLPGHTLAWKNGTEKAGKIQSEVQWAARCSPAHPTYCTGLYAQHTKTIRNAATLQNAPTVRIPSGITRSMMPSISFFFQIKLNKAVQRVKRLERKKRKGRKRQIFQIKQYSKGQRQLKEPTWTWFSSHCDSLFDIICVSLCAQIPTITKQAVHGLQELVLFHMHTPHCAHTSLQSNFQDTYFYCPLKCVGGCLRLAGLQTCKRCYLHPLTCSQHPHEQIPPLKFSLLIKGLSQFLM